MQRAFLHQGRGHHEFAKLFVERALALIASDGILGYVLPHQWAVLRGWEPLRKLLLTGSRTTVVQLRNSAGWLFDNVHHSYMITLVTRTAAEPKVGRVLIWGGARTPAELTALIGNRALELTEKEVADASEGWNLPWFETPNDRTVFHRMRQRPRLGVSPS